MNLSLIRKSALKQFLLKRLLILVVAIVCPALNGSSQCASAVMQNLTANISRPKVGVKCGDTCPVWYLNSDSDITTVNSDDTCDYSDNDSVTWNDGGAITTYMPGILSDGEPDYYFCPSYSPMVVTSYGPGSGTYICEDGYYTSVYTKNTTNGTWNMTCTSEDGYEPPVTYSDLTIASTIFALIYLGPEFGMNTGFPGWYEGVGNELTIGCGFTFTEDPASCEDDKELASYYYTNDSGYITQTLTTETINSQPYNTVDLEGHVDGLAAQGLGEITNWKNGDAQASRQLPSDESSASEQQAKWRIQISGTDPQKKYTISWYIKTITTSGTTTVETSQLESVSGVPGQPGLWYYPSSGGQSVKEPDWPPGCPVGGCNSTTYAGPVQMTQDPD